MVAVMAAWPRSGWIRETGVQSELFKYKVLDIRFPVDNGEDGPDTNMRELVMSRMWEAMG